MRKIASVLFFSAVVFGFAASVSAAGAKANPVNPADYTLTVHISASAYAQPANGLSEVLTATIAGKQYQLQGPTSSSKMFTRGNGLINPGDYHAKLMTDTHKTSYESLQEYEILFPDGTTRPFGVIAQSE